MSEKKPVDTRHRAVRDVVRHVSFDEPAVFEKSVPGRRGTRITPPGRSLPDPGAWLPEAMIRKSPPGLPELSENEAVRHWVRLSSWNFCIDHGFYPLGSCTMKYNPKVNEAAARMEGMARLHPYAPESGAQGALELMWSLERALACICGFDAFTLQPAAGAQGELTALMMIRAHHRAQGNPRSKVLIPDTAHGTNPASAALNGYRSVAVESGEQGILLAGDVAKVMDEEVAAVMITNPNTLGLFEREIRQVARVVHEKGGLVFGDGANLNALMGRVKPGEVGIDVMQLNLHKTFSTPHGGGGPGSGPVGCVEKLTPYLPVPRIVRDEDGSFHLDEKMPGTIGRVRSFYGNFGMLVRAWTYILAVGRSGLGDVSGMSVLNANYLMTLLGGLFHRPYDGTPMHEFVLTDKKLKKETGVQTMDVAKRLLDLGYHPPTVYFPLVVQGALMIEPTETETPETLEAFAGALERIVREAGEDPEVLHEAPHATRLGRLDDTLAARRPVLRWTPGDEEDGNAS
ncbi:MAG: aminomethyl-transferring glycine dehydrogenase subunit GcvPB [Deltaproteobacteria bacterium]|nr:aminomethyl-transferring glycine dehydrogenase subunit GcvPB [Deltaproteobacteria bacterium]